MSANVAFSILFCICFFDSTEKIIRKVKLTISCWMAKKQLSVNVNQSFLQTVVNKVILKEIRI